MVDVAAPSPKFLTHAELRRLLEVARERKLRDYCMILLAYRHGLRASEICGLRVDDLDPAAGQILCRRGKGSLTNWQKLAADEADPSTMDEGKRPERNAVACFQAPRRSPLCRQQFHGILQHLDAWRTCRHRSVTRTR